MERPTSVAGGIYLSARDLQELEASARILYAPFAYGGLDAWRSAANTSLCRIVRADLAMFFLAPELHGPGEEPAPVWSDELSPDQLGNFIRFALHDSGSQLAGAFELTLVTQRALIGENWDAYYADPGVNAFYLPGKIMDAIAFMSWDCDGKKQASIAIHSRRFGTPLFGNEGLARLRLLLPAFQASVAVLASFFRVTSDFTVLLEPDYGAAISTVELHTHFALTSREIQVARLLASGANNDDIGASLHISPHTVRRHTEKVFVKLKARSRAEVGAILRGVGHTTLSTD